MDRDYDHRLGHPRTDLPRSPMEAIEPTRAPSRPKSRRRKRRRRGLGRAMSWLNGLLTLALVVLLALGGSVIWFHTAVTRAGPNDTTKFIKIRSGLGTRSIAAILEDERVISSRHLFLTYFYTRSLWARLNGRPEPSLKAGEYEFKAGDPIRVVVGRIAKGRSALQPVTIPEGLTSHQIVQRLMADERLKGEVTELPAEGFLKPETYLVSRSATRQQVIDLMLEAQRDFLKKAWAARQENLPLNDISEAVILASIVQRETGPNDDPARIASVFINRLRKGMRLQSDPTILYGKFGSQVDWGTTIYRSDINSKTSHNTYQITGLPPTPICNPGKEAIQAVLNPARTQDLYFVADGKGGHIFSRTNKEHIEAVANWRRIERARRRDAANAPARDDTGENAGPGVSVMAPLATDDRAPAPSPTSVREDTPSGTNMTPFGFPLPERRPSR